MKGLFSTLYCLLFVLWAAGMCLAHGVEGYAEKTKAWCVTTIYDNGERMSYAEVNVKAPDSKIAFQTGWTDRNGSFVFMPDVEGVWEVVVEDGMGHRLALEIPVSEDAGGKETAVSDAPVSTPGKNRPMGVVAGIAIIFGLCGFFYGWKARKKCLDEKIKIHG
jgi:nickel transport protein